MNTMVHAAGILSAVWIAFVAFGIIAAVDVVDTATVQELKQVDEEGESDICVSGAADFPSGGGSIRIDGVRYAYAAKRSASDTICFGSQADSEIVGVDLPVGTQLTLGIRVELIEGPILAQATYIGWACAIIALMLVPGLIVAMRYDYLYPVGDND